ncbi:DNA N-6-adenine-methyltransferase [Gallibacterium sp. AGMB14963]|uniref:DNA N-6-adenine-methyltransferase n=1 Tax=Gallibacterium faecale TaxID=3019086 RepID=UPI0022F18562|nr:DNA N-6-adenine-methyltransferase [Gallibacterium sp. AGMB14963]MDA3979554.1 DNA N-6-adenine-methyltransferase [Gallibacterium sp. AGMB14963]
MSFDKDTYPTPLSVFNQIDAEFNFTIDGAALPQNTKLERYVTPEMDFLTYQLENERIWINPPFSDPHSFIKRAVDLYENHNCLVVMLLPVDISTRWFSLVAEKATEIRFIVGGRIKFLNPETDKWTDVCRGNHLAIFNPAHKSMGQAIRHIHISRFKNLEWKQ